MADDAGRHAAGELNGVPPELGIVGMMAFGSLKEAVVILEAEMREASVS